MAVRGLLTLGISQVSGIKTQHAIFLVQTANCWCLGRQDFLLGGSLSRFTNVLATTRDDLLFLPRVFCLVSWFEMAPCKAIPWDAIGLSRLLPNANVWVTPQEGWAVLSLPPDAGADEAR